MRQRLIGATVLGQQDAEAWLGYAITGENSGRQHSSRFGASVDLEAAASIEETWEAELELEAAQEVAAAAGELTEVLRDTVMRLAAGQGAPDGVPSGTWWRRVHDARQAFREEWDSRKK